MTEPPHDPQALAQACAEAMFQDDHASQALGVTLERIASGAARVSMVVTANMVNGHGLCHGGYIFTLADCAFAYACNSYNERTVAREGAITFLRPAHLGERLIAEASERVRAGRSGIYDVRVMRQDGGVIAEFRGHSRQIGQRFFPAEPRPG